MDYLWPLVLLILGVFMLCYPKTLWKMENLLTVKNGEPTELYLLLMRIGGVFLFFVQWASSSISFFNNSPISVSCSDLVSYCIQKTQII